MLETTSTIPIYLYLPVHIQVGNTLIPTICQGDEQCACIEIINIGEQENRKFICIAVESNSNCPSIVRNGTINDEN